MWCERLRRGGTEAEGAAGAERKTRTPHSDVGKKRNAQHPCTPAQWFWWLSRWPFMRVSTLGLWMLDGAAPVGNAEDDCTLDPIPDHLVVS